MITTVRSVFSPSVKGTMPFFVRPTSKTAVALHQTVLENSIILMEFEFQYTKLDRISIVIEGSS